MSPKAYALVREPTRGLEPLTTALQERCATNCATSACPAHLKGLHRSTRHRSCGYGGQLCERPPQ
jgi:hypothetical protein